MRGSIFLLIILAVAPALVFGQADAQNPTQNSKPAKQRSHMTITGCLTGKPDQYRLKDEQGKTVVPYSTKVSEPLRRSSRGCGLLIL
jgi:hypothetical protein